MQRYIEIEHTADIGVEVYGNTIEELFANAGYALFDTIVDAGTIQSTVTRTVSVEGENLEALMMNWLRELLYLFSVEQEVYGYFGVQNLVLRQSSRLLEQDKPCTPKMKAEIKGEPLNFEKHSFETEIKAITYHQFAVIQHNNRWQARVIFDV
jgi:SHS2 domain-containing protein